MSPRELYRMLHFEEPDQPKLTSVIDVLLFE